MRCLSILISLVFFCSTQLLSQCYPDRHSTTATDGWISCSKTVSPQSSLGESHWIRYDFGQSFPLHDVHIWNTSHPLFVKDGIKDAVFSYSSNGSSWITIDTFTVARGEISSFYKGSSVCDLKGLTARYILITALSNHGGDCTGFSEIRFNTGPSDNNLLALDFQACENAGLHKNISGFLDFSGSYSGVGVTDNGDGTFDFDPDKTGPGLTTISYTYMQGNIETVLTDDITVLPCGSDLCPDCTTCQSYNQAIFNSTSILSDIYQMEFISGSGRVQGGFNVDFRARDVVNLYPNFEVKSSGVFKAQIRECYNNEIKNSGFEQNLSNWNWDVSGGATGNAYVQTQEVYEGSESLRINITNSTGNLYEAELRQSGFALEAGKRYKISMAIRAVDIDFFEVRLQKNESPYTQYSLENIYPQNYWNTYELFVDMEETASNVFLSIFCGKFEGQLFIDQVRLTEVIY